MRRSGQRGLPAFLLAVALLAGVISCESIDCTVNNVVTLNVGFYSSDDGSAFSLTDTLTVTALGTDSVLYNRGRGVASVSLPMSYWQEADTLLLHFAGTDETHDVTLIVGKLNAPHFESPDCPTTMFHEITGTTLVDPTGYVDSVVVAKTSVHYGSLENVKIYLHTAD